MATGERQIPGGWVERPSKTAGQRQMRTDQQPAASHPWYRRISLWRSVAGMAVAIAFGCAAIALETASELSSRSANFHRRLELLGSRMARLRTEAADAERELAAVRAERLARADFNRVLSAPDVMVLRLTPSPGSNACGMTAISRWANGAFIEVAGLSAAAGHTSAMWWLMAQGPPAKAAEFNPGAGGRLSLAIPMPPRGARIAGAIITLEPKKPSDKPGGRIMLKGMLPKPQVLS
ncbi:MAG: anti-sigma factor [Deltaproteobacteria bacterium]|nr:anti-sigma factor [Deltaproteobacteria bacterium]